ASEARAALPVLRLGDAGLLPPAAATQRRQVEDLEAQEPRQPQPLSPGRLFPGSDAELPRLDELLHARWARGVHARGVRRRVRARADLARRTGLRPREADVAERRLSPRAVDRGADRAAARPPALRRVSRAGPAALPRADRHARGLLRLRVLLLR